MINSHYVPQFILRNFYTDDKITYCDLEKRTVQLRNTRSVFSEDGYYPENIEKALCDKAEHLFANLYHNKLENARNTITLTRDELFVLKKYLVVCSVRYKYEFTEEEKRRIKSYGPAFEVDYDRCLNEILSCETLDEVFELLGKYEKYLYNTFQGKDSGDSSDANMPLWSELKDILHSYIIFVKTRDEQFLIPDVGRATYQGPLGLAKTISVTELFYKTQDPRFAQLLQLIGPRDYTVYPLSKNFAIVSMCSFFKLFTDSEVQANVKMPDEYPTLSSLLEFGDRNIIAPPKVRFKGYYDREYIYDIKTLTTKDVCHFNSLMMGECKRYIACGGLEGIQQSVETAKNYTKRDLSFLKIKTN
jgi:hypothetical protein